MRLQPSTKQHSHILFTLNTVSVQSGGACSQMSNNYCHSYIARDGTLTFEDIGFRISQTDLSVLAQSGLKELALACST